ncbi:hypothetical protein [Clostridium botulinum]|uniref:hypothetical protein n=1 Tax=Clostridium botulinum TaxID=1491 RepID=UPI0004D01C13|nr:hypothetical protein [Clostridium botulinum]
MKSKYLTNKKIHDLKINISELSKKQEQLKRNMEQNKLKMHLVKEQFPDKNIKDLMEIQNKINTRKRELESFIENEFIKSTWNKFKNNISCISAKDINRYEKKYENNEKIYFYSKDVIKEYFSIEIDVPESVLIIKNEYGFLPNTKEILEEYFRKSEELNLLQKYDIPDIELIQANEKFFNINLLDIEKKIELLNEELSKYNDEKSNEYGLSANRFFVEEISLFAKDDTIKNISEIINFSNKNWDSVEDYILVALNDLLDYNLEEFEKNSLKNNIVLSKKAIKILINLKELDISPRIDRYISEILHNEGNMDLDKYNKILERIHMEVKHNFDYDTFLDDMDYDFYETEVYNDKEDILKDLENLKNEVSLIQNNNYEEFIGQEELDKIILRTKIKIITIYYIKIETLLKIKKYKKNTSTQTYKRRVK